MALCGLVFILLEFHPTGIKLIIICSKKISLFAQLFVIVLYQTKTKKIQIYMKKILLLVSFIIITS